MALSLEEELNHRKTRSAVIWSSLLSVPLLAVYNFIAVILYRDLGGSPLQITLLTMLKPLGALFSLYWSAQVLQREDRLLSNVLWAGVLARLPFFVYPFIEGPWILLASVGIFWMLARGGIPAWMEILKRNLPPEKRNQVFSRGSALGYVEGVVLAIAIGKFLDQQPDAWRWIFPLSAVIGIIGVFFQARTPFKIDPKFQVKHPKETFGLRSITQPWVEAKNLIKSRTDFRQYQWGFMLAGSAMMVIQPALPIFFVDILGVTYTELAIALTVCKGLGFAATSPLWARRLSHSNVFRTSSAVFLFVGFFPLFLIFSPVSHLWLYLAYFIYGIAQAGSELCWHLSGPIFSKNGDSSLFSSVNVMMVGVRGAIIPPLGILFCTLFSPYAVFVLSMALCLMSSVMMARFAQRKIASSIV